MKTIGILGGGQLGKMILESAYNYPNRCYFLDQPDSPCQAMTKYFIEGDIRDYETVFAFGQTVDVLGIEIEHVNIDALFELEKRGKTVIPSAITLQTIQDKGLQKDFYHQHDIKTPNYFLIDSKADFLTHYTEQLKQKDISFPLVQKLRTGGYDGQGVQVIKHQDELNNLWDKPSVIEQFTNIDKEIAVIVIKDSKGNNQCYPPVEMHFDPNLNLVDYLFSPSKLSDTQVNQAIDLAIQVANSFNGQGIFAVEMFLDKAGKLWVNEVAPRVHNSGHHTIEAAYCSQFEQVFRLLAGYPIGSTALIESSAMINLVGEQSHAGDAKIEGLDHLLTEEKAYLHWYGKSKTKPGRKMGHVTLLDEGDSLKELLKKVKRYVKVTSK